MKDHVFKEGDRIVLHCESGKWRSEVIPGKGGAIAPSAVASFASPEEALAALRKAASGVIR